MFTADGNDHVAYCVWLDGILAYEKPLPMLFCRLARSAKRVAIVGANTGLYALVAARISSTAIVEAFEPLPEAIFWLKKNVAANRLEHRIWILEAAVGPECGTDQLLLPPKRFGQTIETSASLNSAVRSDSNHAIAVPVVTLDSQRHKHDCPYDVVLMDVEGYEPKVLSGAQRVIEHDQPIILTEILEPEIADQLEAWRRGAGYCFAAVIGEEVRHGGKVRCIHGSANHILFPAARHDFLRVVVQESGLRWIEVNA